jgi:hypothetical protein
MDAMDAMGADLQESFDRVLRAALDELVASHPAVAASAHEVAGPWAIPPDDTPWSQSHLCHVCRVGLRPKLPR